MNDNGFTLLEMLMVVFIIAALLILTIPNIIKHQEGVENTSCDAYLTLVQTQVAAYKMTNDQIPSIQTLVSEGYLASDTCSDGSVVTIDGDGNAIVNE